MPKRPNTLRSRAIRTVISTLANAFGWQAVLRALGEAGREDCSRTIVRVSELGLEAFRRRQVPDSFDYGVPYPQNFADGGDSVASYVATSLSPTGRNSTHC